MTTDTQAKALEQALREVDCSCGADGAPKGYIIHPDRGQPLLYLEHKACHGTGRVPWLKGVRVGCAWLEQARRLENFPLSLHPKDCEDCQGRDWKPSLDLAIWHKAVLALPRIKDIWVSKTATTIVGKPYGIEVARGYSKGTGLRGLLLALKEMKP